MKLHDFEPYRRLTTRSQARDALDQTLSETRHTLRLFDDRGEFFGFERRVFSETLFSLLAGNGEARVRLVLHETEHVERNCPRLVALVRSFSPRLQILRTDASIRGYSRGFVLADEAVVLRRAHFEQSLTFVDYDEKAIGAAATLFEEILGHATVAIGSHVTGL